MAREGFAEVQFQSISPIREIHLLWKNILQNTTQNFCTEHSSLSRKMQTVDQVISPILQQENGSKRLAVKYLE